MDFIIRIIMFILKKLNPIKVAMNKDSKPLIIISGNNIYSKLM